MPLFRRKSDKNEKSSKGPEKESIRNGERDPYLPGVRPRVPLLPLPDDYRTNPSRYEHYSITDSRLNKNLDQSMTDKTVLPKFIEFLITQNSDHLAHFWTEADSFRVAALNSRDICSQEQCDGRTTGIESDSGVRDLNDAQEHGEASQSKQISVGTIHSLCNNNALGSPVQLRTTRLRTGVEQDASSLFARYIGPEAQRPLDLPDDVKHRCISQMCPESGDLDPDCFIECQQHVYHKLVPLFDEFRRSMYFCSYQVEVLLSSEISLSDIIYCDNTVFLLTEFLENENATDLLQFLIAVHNFERQEIVDSLDTEECQQRQNDAMVIYERYLSMQATRPLGIDDRTRLEVECNICQETGPDVYCFRPAQHLIMHTLQLNYFSNFLQSQIYYKFLSDLVNTLQVNADLYGIKKQRGLRSTNDDDNRSQLSDSSSFSAGDDSISRRNPLLASGTLRQATGAASSEDIFLSAEERNPELMWKRPLAGKMSIGHVDALGQFQSNFFKGSEKKKGLFRRNTAKDQAQQQLAWNFAAMLINDVNSMTQTEEDSD